MKANRPISSDWVTVFNNAGFSILPGVVSELVVSELINDLKETNPDSSVRQKLRNTYAIRNLLNVPAVRALSELFDLRSLVEPVLGKDAIAVRGLLFDKTPEANWKVAWHQDLSIAVRQRANVSGFGPWSVKAGVQHVQPPTNILENMLTVRLHLDECGSENGPLRVLPGSHRSGKLTSEQIALWHKQTAPMTCCVARGGVMLMRPLLLHSSSTAITPRHRRVIHLEFASGRLPGELEWFENQSFAESRECV